MTEVTAGASGTEVPEQRADDRADDPKDSGRHSARTDEPADEHRSTKQAGGPGGRGRVDERGERPLERADRNMLEMLQELRVAQTGVQILFAFLLSLSFTERFTRIDDFQRWTYVVTLLLTALTTGLLVAPAAIHRMLFGRGVKAATVRIGHHLFIAGLASLTLTLMGAVLLVLDVAVGRTFALWAAAATGIVLILLWFVLPLPVRTRNDREDDDGPDGADKE
jgi:Family of unknown function (DUF6328)